MEKFHFYKLKKIHNDSIRAMTTFKQLDGSKKLITVSRDSEAKVFSLNSSGLIDFDSEYTFFLPTQISTVCVLDKADFPTIVFIFGCLNGHIYVFHGYERDSVQCITEHTKNVCIIKSNASMNRVASGSWDHTAIVYEVNNFVLKKLYVISGHTESVMDLHFINMNSLLTGSSDRSIILWELQQMGAIQLQSFVGHEDCVRGIMFSEQHKGFYSISNDQTIRFWNLETTMTDKIFVGHQHFIFHINKLSNEYFVSCGENHAVLLWNFNETNPWQSLKLPTVTIWSVLATNLNVFYAAGSDGILYVFTNLKELQPDDESEYLYDEMLVKQTKIPFSSVAHLKLYEENSLTNIPPTGTGDRRLIRSLQDNTILVYEWNKTWKPIGHVSDYNQNDNVDQITGRVPYNDELYDEVFNVKLNQKNYKLPYNRDENPWIAAQTFIEQNQLDYATLNSLVQCIVNYSSYKPKKTDDYFASNYFPMFDFKLWTQQPNLEAFRKKFEEFNNEVEDDLKLLPNYLNLSTSELQNPEPFCAEFCEAFDKLFKWPEKFKFIIYDLLRILLTNKYFNTYFLNRIESNLIGDNLILLNTIVRCDNILSSQLTSLRVLANLFTSVHGAEFMAKKFDFIRENIINWSTLITNLNVHLAYSSIWFNYSVLLGDWRKKQNFQLKTGIMKKLTEHAELNPIELENYDKVILELMNTFGNLVASKFHSEQSDNYLKLLKSYPDFYKNKPDLQYRLRQIEVTIESLN